MLQELAEAMEALSAQRPAVLVMEDLHGNVSLRRETSLYCAAPAGLRLLVAQ
jgi:hypothetical protein